MPLIELAHVRRAFDGGRIVAVDDISLTVAEGETVAIVGRSGSGKSTLLNLMCGLDLPTAGAVRFAGKPVTGRAAWATVRAEHFGFVFQNFNLISTLNVHENVEVAMLGRPTNGRSRAKRVAALLERLGLAGRSHLHPNSLSGGERQRLAIARALANNPDVLVADEPTGSLDRVSSDNVMEIISELHRDFGTAVVIVTHDSEVAAVCTRHVELADGRIVRTGETGEASPDMFTPP